MHNLNVNNIRRSIREGANVDVDKHCDRLPSISDPSASLLLRDLEWALAKLTVERRQGILLVGLEGMSYPEAAEVLDIPIGTLRSRISRGRHQLRRLLGVEEDGTGRPTSPRFGEQRNTATVSSESIAA
jgi:RNA polymerase sigma-70 factor (ECF subfamily)